MGQELLKKKYPFEQLRQVEEVPLHVRQLFVQATQELSVEFRKVEAGHELTHCLL